MMSKQTLTEWLRCWSSRWSCSGSNSLLNTPSLTFMLGSEIVSVPSTAAEVKLTTSDNKIRIQVNNYASEAE